MAAAGAAAQSTRSARSSRTPPEIGRKEFNRGSLSVAAIQFCGRDGCGGGVAGEGEGGTIAGRGVEGAGGDGVCAAGQHGYGAAVQGVDRRRHVCLRTPHIPEPLRRRLHPPPRAPPGEVRRRHTQFPTVSNSSIRHNFVKFYSPLCRGKWKEIDWHAAAWIFLNAFIGYITCLRLRIRRTYIL